MSGPTTTDTAAAETFGGPTLRPSRRLAGLRTFCWFALLLIAADFALRWVDPMKLYGGWENAHVQYKLQCAQNLKRQRGRIDVMLFSSSIGLQTDVAMWQEAFGDQIVCYNAAIGGQRPEWAQFLWEQVYEPATHPTHVIYCICPRDVNGVSDPPEKWSHNGPLWKSLQVRRRLEVGQLNHSLASFESLSYLFQARHHLRRYLQQGPIPEDEITYTQSNGVNLPAVRRLPEDIRPVSAEERSDPSNHYHRFSFPEEGEMRALVQMANSCKAHGIEFAVVNQPIAPYAQGFFDDPKKDYALYLQGLDKLRAQGVRVVDMAAALPLTNSDFGDAEHPNRWGGFRVTNFLYTQVLKPWFPATPGLATLPEFAEALMYRQLSNTNASFYLQDYSKVYPALFGNSSQLVTQRAGGVVPLAADLPAGSYRVRLYGADEQASAGKASNAPGHPLALHISASGKPDTYTETPFEMSRKLVQGAAMTVLPLELTQPSRIDLEVKELHGPECVLDTVFFEPVLTPSLHMPDLAQVSAAAKPAQPQTVRNGGFEFTDLRRKNWPAEWLPYTGERPPWGSVRIATDMQHSGQYSIELQHDPALGGWGSVAMQHTTPDCFEELRGRKVEASVWVHCTQPDVYGALTIAPSGEEHKFSAYSTPGQWQRLSTVVDVPTTASSLTGAFGVMKGNRAHFDDFMYELKP